MQKYQIVLLIVFATFISIEARPWYDDYSSGENSGNEFSEDGYAEQALDAGYRSDDAYGNRIGSNNRGVGGYGYNGYGNSGYGGNGFDSRKNGVRRVDPNQHNVDYAAFMPRVCHGCKVNSFGNGNYNRNTFNLPKGMFD